MVVAARPSLVVAMAVAGCSSASLRLQLHRAEVAASSDGGCPFLRAEWSMQIAVRGDTSAREGPQQIDAALTRAAPNMMGRPKYKEYGTQQITHKALEFLPEVS